MKVKNIKLTIKDKKEVLEAFANNLSKARKGETILKHDEISFKNIYALREFITEKRLELLHIIKHYNPKSIYELAKIVNRDLKSINTDINILKKLDLISLQKSKDERKKTMPLVEFNRINVEITI